MKYYLFNPKERYHKYFYGVAILWGPNKDEALILSLDELKEALDIVKCLATKNFYNNIEIKQWN